LLLEDKINFLIFCNKETRKVSRWKIGFPQAVFVLLFASRSIFFSG
jgi:hypothetical protein